MKIIVSPEEFFSVVMIYLLDKINNPKSIGPWSEDIDEAINKIKNVKAHLTNYYLNANLDDRIFYKRLKPVFQKTDFSGSYNITIKDKYVNENYIIDNNNIDKDVEETDLSLNEPEINKEKEDLYKLKDSVMETIKRIKKRKFKTAKYITNEEIEKIIEDVIKKHKGE